MGHKVLLVSVTNGDIGHYSMAGGVLAKRRIAEVKECAKVLGVESKVLDIHDGELVPTLENRKKDCTRHSRMESGHRDFASPMGLPSRPSLCGGSRSRRSVYGNCQVLYAGSDTSQKEPRVFCTQAIGFLKPYPFRPDVVLAVDNVFEQKSKRD